MLPDSVLYTSFGLFCGVGTSMAWRTRSKIMQHLNILRRSATFNKSNSNYIKYVICVRQDLKMGKGKIAAQCSHAAVKSYKKLLNHDQLLLTQWELCGQNKSVLKCLNEEELLTLSKDASNLGLPTAIILDAGKTQLNFGTRTVLGIGPGPENLVNKITGHLKLL